MQKGARRGLGQPGSLVEPIRQLWVGGNPITDPAGAAGDAQGYTGTKPIAVYFKNAARPNNPGAGADGFIFIDDYRRIEQNGVASSGIPGDNSATIKLWLQPTFATAVTDYSLNGVTVGGFIGQGSPVGANVTLATAGRFAAFASHLDTGVPVYGMYGLSVHLGLVPASTNVATEMVGVDINALNSFGSTATSAYGFRLLSNVGMAGLTNWGLMLGATGTAGTSTAMVNQIRGPVTLGGAADNTKPVAQVDIQNLTALANSSPGTAIQSLTDTPASGSALQRQTFRSLLLTTNASAAPVWLFTLIATGRYFIRGTLMARQTGGAGGVVGQGAAWTLTGGFKDRAVDGALVATLMGTLPTGWAAPTSTIFAGAAISINVQGAVNQNVTWHLEVDIFGPLVS